MIKNDVLPIFYSGEIFTAWCIFDDLSLPLLIVLFFLFLVWLEIPVLGYRVGITAIMLEDDGESVCTFQTRLFRHSLIVISR